MENPWDRDVPFDYSSMWMGTDTVVRHIHRKVSGDENVNWLEYSIAKYVLVNDGAKRCLVLGASEGNVERALRSAGFTGPILSTDVAGNALRRAEERSRALGYSGIEYRVADLNTERFEGPFDYIFAEGVLHHIARLESCLEHLREILAPDGVLVANEFEGPFRFQLSDPQMRWINAALAVLPMEYRPMNGGVHGVPATAEYLQRIQYVRATAESVEQMDPTEAVSGPQLKALLPEIFQVVEKKGFGGTLLSYMSGHFPFAQANSDARVDRWLRVLLEIEEAVIESGLLDDEFVFYVARQRSATRV